MGLMFYKCESLEKINLPNFNINNYSRMKYMFSECSRRLKNKVKNINDNIVDEAF